MTKRWCGLAAAAAMNMPLASCQASPGIALAGSMISPPPPMKTARGAASAMNSWLSTGSSSMVWPTAQYLRKLPAIQ